MPLAWTSSSQGKLSSSRVSVGSGSVWAFICSVPQQPAAGTSSSLLSSFGVEPCSGTTDAPECNRHLGTDRAGLRSRDAAVDSRQVRETCRPKASGCVASATRLAADPPDSVSEMDRSVREATFVNSSSPRRAPSGRDCLPPPTTTGEEQVALADKAGPERLGGELGTADGQVTSRRRFQLPDRIDVEVSLDLRPGGRDRFQRPGPRAASGPAPCSRSRAGRRRPRASAPPPLRRRRPRAASRSPTRGLGHVFDATYFGFVFRGSAMTCSSSGAFGQYAAKIS